MSPFVSPVGRFASAAAALLVVALAVVLIVSGSSSTRAHANNVANNVADDTATHGTTPVTASVPVAASVTASPSNSTPTSAAPTSSASTSSPVAIAALAAAPTAHPALAPVPTGHPVASNTGRSQSNAGGAATVNLAPNSSIAQAVLSALNTSRQQAGLAPLSFNSGLQASAHQHNLTMAAANSLSHQLPGEDDFGIRERAQGVSWSAAGENIGDTSNLSTSGALGIESLMMAEPPNQQNHRGNILSTQYNIVGIDIVLDTAHNQLWLTEDFARV